MSKSKTHKPKSYTAEISEICENGDAILDLPDELLKDMGWSEGTVLNIELIDGVIFLTEVKK